MKTLRTYLLVLFLCLSSLFVTGCASFKAEVGEYVKEAVIKTVEDDIDAKLATKQLSIAEIKSALVLNDPRGTVGMVKDLARAFVMTESDKFVARKLLQAGVVSQDQLETKSAQMWNWIVVTFSTVPIAFLAKLLHSKHNNAAFDSRLGLVEKLLSDNKT